jgi:hypothetical protein
VQLYRGLIRAYDETTHTAAILLAGSLSRTLLNVPVAHHIAPELMAEGAACALAFFEDQAHALVVATFEGAPDAWVTADLLTFSPATPEGALDNDNTDQTLTTTATTYSTLTQTVTVASGKTIRVLVIASVEFECTSYTNYNIDLLEIYAGSSGVGQAQAYRTNAVNHRGSVTVAIVTDITADTTFTAKVRKAVDRNTEVAHRGNMVTLWWENT